MTELGIVDIRELIKFVKSKYNYDFSDFALTSFKHKLERILIKNNLSSIENLIKKLKNNIEFFDIFLHEISVPSTEMFRDPSLWRWLRDDLFATATEKTLSRFKIWLPNSVSGGELYSLAILLKEINILDKVEIISSSYSDKSIEYIKEGIYDLKKIEISKENYKRFKGTVDFSDYFKLDRYYAIRDISLIKNVVFKKQSINFDNSPTNVKLILFRNNLIYFNPSLQNRVLDLMYDILSATGHLVVGVKEEVLSSGSTSIFEAVNKSEGIFKKKLSAK